MDYMTKQKEGHIGNWKKMSMEDKILLVMEGICYLLTIGTLIAVVFVIDKGFIGGVGILLFSAVGLASCGLNARASRDSYIAGWRLGSKMSKEKPNKRLIG